MLVEEWLYMIGGVAVFIAYVKWLHTPVSYTHLTLPTNREV